MVESPQQRFVFAGCTNLACRFRYPAADDDPRREQCPRCGALTEQIEALSFTAASASEPATARPFVALLDNIRSTHNAGSMFRTADGAGLDHLFLCGITATPEHPKLSKAALGTQGTIPWTYSPNGPEIAAALRSGGYRLIALERLGPAPTPAEAATGPIALVVGNERAGVDPAILSQCDAILSLPMIGRKASLNAAVAFGIAVYALRFGAGAVVLAPGGSSG